MPGQIDTRPDVLVARVAAEQWGVLSLAELRACGLDSDGIALRATTGRLHRIHRGVYAVGHDGLTWEGRWLAAVKACGAGALLSHRSAAMCWGLLDSEEGRIDVTVGSSGTRRVPGLTVHRSPVPVEDRRRKDGIALTSPERTVVDTAAALGFEPLRRVVREAQAERLVSVISLLRTLDRMGRPRGSANLRKILATGPAPTRSELEDVVLDLLLKGGFEHPDVNKPLIVAGRRVVPDFRWPRQRLIVEADGLQFHGSRLAREDDAERQALLEANGERLLRVTWNQAVRRADETRRRFAAAGVPRMSS